MAWGAAGGSPMHQGSAVGASAAAGLPFAGMPEELAERAQHVLDEEPEHPDPAIEFSQVVVDHRRFTLRRFLVPHTGALLLALALVVIETVALQAGPLLVAIGIDDGVSAGDTSTLVAVFVVYLVAIVVNAVSTWGRIRFTGRLGERLMLELRVRVFSHLQRLSLDFFTREKAGRLMTRMTSDIEALTQLFQEGLVQLAVQGLTLVVITIFLLWLNPALTAITLVLVVPALLAATLWFRRASSRGYMRVRDRIADVLADLSESLAGMRIITANNRRRHNLINHTNIVGEHLDANLYTSKIGAVYGPGTEAMGVVAQGLVLLIGGQMVLSGSLSIGELTAFVLFITRFFAPIQQLIQLYNSYQQGSAAVGKLADLLGTQPSVPERLGAVDLPPVAGRIDLDNVDFGYNADVPVLTDVSLHIGEGETFALVGPTGGGKSTIAKLVTRFYDPTDGRVAIDGHDLRDVTLRSLRGQLGVVPQEPFLFHASIRENVAFANPDATDKEVWEACRAVGLDDLVARLPDGLDSPCHERGASLSAGERQLLALARAFLARPRVLVLDEATSNLDLRSESKIEGALDMLREGRTAILIAHRLATAMRADRIAVVDRGQIVELGTHDELIALGGRYADMYATWTSHAVTADT